MALRLQSSTRAANGALTRVLADPRYCAGCHKEHNPRFTAHIGDPSDWSAERISLGPYRELTHEFERFCWSFSALRRDLTTTERLALCLHLAAGSLPVCFLAPGRTACGEDRQLYIAPQGAQCRLLCGVVQRIGADGTDVLRAPVTIQTPSGELLAAIGLTGTWWDIAYPSRSSGPQDLPALLALGGRVSDRIQMEAVR